VTYRSPTPSKRRAAEGKQIFTAVVQPESKDRAYAQRKPAQFGAMIARRSLQRAVRQSMEDD
jgi:hypothetical protein